jgi:uncharacterized protein YndB with AHSA1/START domain
MFTATVIVVIVALAVAALLAFAATRPGTFRIQRTTSIKSPPEKIFPHLEDLHAHSTWSPFEKDPNMKRTHSGASKGKGAVYEWDGNRQVGAGRIAITDTVPNSKVMLKLDMFRPFPAHNVVEFTLVPNGSGTNVSWAMQGPQPFMAKVMSTFINCDKMVGTQFEEGLAKLKAIAER